MAPCIRSQVRAVLAGLALLVISELSWAEPLDLVQGEQLHLEPVDDSVIAQVRRRGLLRVGFDLFEPWTMCDMNGGLIGQEIDIARKLAADMGVRIQFVRTDWYFIMAALIDEQFDMIVSGTAITADRALLVNFTIPVAESGPTLIANSALTEGRTDFNDPDVIFAVRAGTTTETVMRAQFPKASMLFVASTEEKLQALLAGNAHIAYVSQIVGTRWLAAHPEALREPFGERFNLWAGAIAIRKGDFDSLNFLNRWITQHRTNGWLEERRQYWFESLDWEDQVATDESVLAACAEAYEL